MVEGLASRRGVLLSMAAAGAIVPTLGWAASKTAVVETTGGRIQGYRDRGVSVFKGVRYAAPPVGPRRFKAPGPLQPRTGVQPALAYGAQCPQVGIFVTGIYASVGKSQPDSEDCLFLNVWTPATDNRKRPVMVWLHGGGFESGSGSNHWYDGVNLATRGDVVVVTINHRLNIFGYGYLAQISGEAGDADSGMAGALDMVAALRWVRDNIGRFGGDPDNVTLFGESGGGLKVGLLMAMPVAQPLFARGICQSGSLLRVREPAPATANMRKIVDKLGGGAEGLRRIRTLPADQLVAAMSEALRIDSSSLRAGSSLIPVVDGRNLSRQPFDRDAPPFSAGKPLVVGTTRTETARTIGARDPGSFGLDRAGLLTKLKTMYPAADLEALVKPFEAANPTADPSRIFFLITTANGFRREANILSEHKAAQGRGAVYQYDLTWTTPVDGGKWGSPHGLDIPLVFDNVAKAPSLTGPETAQTEAVSDAMVEAWLAFARTGDPSTPKRAWPKFDSERRATMLFDVDSRVVDDPYRTERQAVEPLTIGRLL